MWCGVVWCGLVQCKWFHVHMQNGLRSGHKNGCVSAGGNMLAKDYQVKKHFISSIFLH